MTWIDNMPYATFKYDSAGVLDPVMLCNARGMSDEEFRGVLNKKQIEELYALPHTPEDPATADVVALDGTRYRVVRADEIRVRMASQNSFVHFGRQEYCHERLEDLDRGYVWTRPFHRGEWKDTGNCLKGTVDILIDVSKYSYGTVKGFDVHVKYNWNSVVWTKNGPTMPKPSPVDPAKTPVAPSNIVTITPQKPKSAAPKNKRKSNKAYAPKRSEAQLYEDMKWTEFRYDDHPGHPALSAERDYENIRYIYSSNDDLASLSKDKESIAVFALPAKYIHLVYSLGFFDAFEKVLLLPSPKKTDVKDLEAYGWNMAYVAGREEQATPELEHLFIPDKGRAKYTGLVPDGLFEMWAKERLLAAVCDANKDVKYLFKFISNRSYSGSDIADLADILTFGGCAGYDEYIRPLADRDIYNLVYRNDWDMRPEEYVARSFDKYIGCDFDFEAGEAAEAVSRDAALMGEAIKIWNKELPAARKKSAFLKLVVENDCTYGDYAYYDKFTDANHDAAKELGREIGIDVEIATAAASL